MDRLGADNVVATLQRLAAQYGDRFMPCEILLHMAQHGITFWPNREAERVS